MINPLFVEFLKVNNTLHEEGVYNIIGIILSQINLKSVI